MLRLRYLRPEEASSARAEGKGALVGEIGKWHEVFLNWEDGAMGLEIVDGVVGGDPKVYCSRGYHSLCTLSRLVRLCP